MECSRRFEIMKRKFSPLDLRIKEHPIIEFKRDTPVHFTFEGQRIEAFKGESVAAALFALGVRELSRSVKFGRPRGFFCAIGKCSSCMMRVNQVPNVRTCIVPVEDGMVVERQDIGADLPGSAELETEKERLRAELVVVGGGPAGLSAATSSSKMGIDTVILDENFNVGGQLVKQTHKFFGSREWYAGVRGFEVAKRVLKELKGTDTKLIPRASVLGCYRNKRYVLVAVQDERKLIEIETNNVVVATGAKENMLAFPNNDLPGVCGAGGVQTLMNVYGMKPGNSALIVGAGNVGLILGYQLAQADVDVKMVIEAAPKIGGYLVHASKLRRLGIPILTSHTIKEAHGTKAVKAATIVGLDENWRPIERTEKEVDVDLICLAAGLSPSSELLSQAGCQNRYIADLGGYVALHNRNLETTLEGVYVAGDSSGIEDADAAMIEGKICAAEVAVNSGKAEDKAKGLKKRMFRQLKLLRSSPFSSRVKRGKDKVWALMKEA